MFAGKFLCWSLFLISLQVWRSASFLKRFFPVNIREFSGTSILKNICERMLLSRSSKCSNKSTAIVTWEHPNHKSKIVSPPPGAFSKPDIYCRKGWQCIQDICNEFPSQCKEKYLQSFQEFQKWEDKKRNFKIGILLLYIRSMFQKTADLWQE